MRRGRASIAGCGPATASAHSRISVAIGEPGIRDAGLRADVQRLDLQASLLYKLTPSLALHGLAGRGFRAPNLNDLGAIGLNDLGYEVPAREAANALLADSSGEGAISKGVPLRTLGVERLLEPGSGAALADRAAPGARAVFRCGVTRPDRAAHVAPPANAVPTAIAGLAVTPIPQTAAQRAQGVVTVASAIDPRALKSFVNDGRSRYRAWRRTGSSGSAAVGAG